MHDRIGEAIPEANCPYGVFLNPKNCEFGNASFLGIRKDDVLLFSIDGREERIREVCEDILSKASLASIEDDLIRFSRLQTKSDFAEYASEHGPLFGGTYLRENGIIEEPLSMWKLAASFFELAFRLKAVIDEDSWNGSVYWDGKEVIFGSLIFLDKEQVREVAKKQRLTHKETEEAIFSASVVLPCAINPDYARFTMTEEEIQKRVYCSGRWDEPGAEMKYWHPFVKAIPNLMQMDILKGKMAMIEARAGFDVAIQCLFQKGDGGKAMPKPDGTPGQRTHKICETRMDWAQFHLLLRRQATLHVVRIRHLHGQETRRHLRLLRQALHENAVESEALPWRMHP